MILNKNKKINPDLDEERKKCKFDVEELSIWWHGGKQKLYEKRIFEKLLVEDSTFKDEIPFYYLSQKELYEQSVEKSIDIINRFRQLQKNSQHDFLKKMTIADLFKTGILKFSPVAMNYVMFIPTLNALGTEEQKKLWIEKAMNLKIITAFAQTELGHGTFVRGLETRADYDPKTEEFILNSPTLTSYKWWPGGLAHTANYAVVLAQLYSKGICHGVFQFVVQIRDEETHQPLPGIKLGNIGPKMEMHTIDNGYAAFTNVRVPRTSMLMGNAKLLKDGVFIKPKITALVYAPMTNVRVGIVRSTTYLLTEAVTIATRYSVVRRQSPIEPNEPEPKIIEHVTQQLKIFPQISRAVVFKIIANFVTNLYENITSELKKGDIIRLPELHALTCCLKAVVSEDVAKSIELLRLACGGHGYMSCAGLHRLYGQATAACTYEGENTVLFLQTGRYLLKAWQKVLDGQIVPPSVEYLKEFIGGRKFTLRFDGSVPSIIKAYEVAAANKIRIAFAHFQKRVRDGMSIEQANNATGIEICQAADMHCRLFIISTAYSQMPLIIKGFSDSLATVFSDLIELYALEACFEKLGDVLRFVSLTNNDIIKLQQRFEHILVKIRPNAVGIVDAFEIHDAVLDSTLGAYDGNVYERMFVEAQKSPLNQEAVNKSFHLYLKPFIKSNL